MGRENCRVGENDGVCLSRCGKYFNDDTEISCRLAVPVFKEMT